MSQSITVIFILKILFYTKGAEMSKHSGEVFHTVLHAPLCKYQSGLEVKIFLNAILMTRLDMFKVIGEIITNKLVFSFNQTVHHLTK